MPGHLLNFGAAVQCSHGGTATPLKPNPRVLVNGEPTLVLPGNAMVAGCPLPKNGPFCQTALWTQGTTRVTSGGQPLVLDSGQSTCAATGQQLVVLQCQQKVTAT